MSSNRTRQLRADAPIFIPSSTTQQQPCWSLSANDASYDCREDISIIIKPVSELSVNNDITATTTATNATQAATSSCILLRARPKKHSQVHKRNSSTVISSSLASASTSGQSGHGGRRRKRNGKKQQSTGDTVRVIAKTATKTTKKGKGRGGRSPKWNDDTDDGNASMNDKNDNGKPEVKLHNRPSQRISTQVQIQHSSRDEDHTYNSERHGEEDGNPMCGFAFQAIHNSPLHDSKEVFTLPLDSFPPLLSVASAISNVPRSRDIETSVSFWMDTRSRSIVLLPPPCLDDNDGAGPNRKQSLSEAACNDPIFPLTVLRGARDTMPMKRNTTLDTSVPDVPLNEEATITFNPELCRPRLRDITKLRDRWWRLIQDKPSSSVAFLGKECNEAGTFTQAGTPSERRIVLQYYSDDPEGVADTRDTAVSPASRTFSVITSIEKYCSPPSSTSCSSSVSTSSVSSSPSPPSTSLAHPYEEVKDYMILEAVESNDPDLLKQLVRKSYNGNVGHRGDSEFMSPLQRATYLDRPHLVRILATAARKETTFQLDNPKFKPAIIVAAEEGYDESLQLLLGLASFQTTRDVYGNNVLHACCQGKGTTSTLDIILYTGASTFTKLLLGTNYDKETPLHTACRCGRVDLVDVILSPSSFAGSKSMMLMKVLTAQDINSQTPLLAAVAAGSTDVVMSLLMWRGNNHYAFITSGTNDAPCPLSWAVRAKNVEMVLLLLEFCDPSRQGLDVHSALQRAVFERHPDESLDLLRVLVEAGANPFDSMPICSHSVAIDARSALVIAVDRQDTSAIRTLLHTYNSHIEREHSARRRDPILVLQPESFFASMEARVNEERNGALCEALARCLSSIATSSLDPSGAVKCALALYDGGARLGTTGITLLKRTFQPTPKRQLDECSTPGLVHYECKYHHLMGPSSYSSESVEAMGYWSQIMLLQPWAATFVDSDCPWIKRNQKPLATASVIPPDFVIVAEDGTRFPVHSVVVSQKSAKLAAAYRFANMSRQETVDDALPETRIAICSSTCAMFLHHIYHGSLPCVKKLSVEQRKLVYDLILVADEFLCHSLLQECEMRMVSSQDDAKRCFCWNCCSKRGPKSDGEPLVVPCFYNVVGGIFAKEPFGNIEPHIALDLFALAQHIEEDLSGNVLCTNDNGCSVELIANEIPHRLTPLRTMEALNSVALNTILDNFLVSTSRDALDCHVENLHNETDYRTAQETLLHGFTMEAMRYVNI